MKKELKIKYKKLIGIRHPMLLLRGYSFATKLLVVEDEAKNEIYKTVINKKFELEIPIEKHIDNIYIYLGTDKKRRLYDKIKNVTYIRFFNEILYNIRNFFLKISKLIAMIYKGFRFLWREHHFIVPPIFWKKYVSLFFYKISNKERKNLYNPFVVKEYNEWLDENEVEEEIETFKYNPLISIAIPVYNIDKEYLSECLDSILKQTYQNFEVCLADDNSTSEETINTLKLYEKKDKRIKVIYRKENGHISKATNSALELCAGEYIGLIDDDDTLPNNALYECVKALNKDKSIDMIYTDEDKIDMAGKRCEPHFKSDYAVDSLFGGNYICHFPLMRKSILDQIGYLNNEYVGAQDFDLFLRFTEKAKNIHHIPKVLYHWRKVPGSTADTVENKEYAIENGRKAVEAALKRRGLKGEVYTPIKTTHYIVKYTYDKEPLISIIIPTKDQAPTLRQCLDSIYKKTTYKNYEIIIVDNNSTDKKTFKLFDEYKQLHKNIKIVKADMDFNYSKINNLGIKEAKGDYILLLNNDTKVISKDWLNNMVGYAMQKHIGAVGVKLLYPDDTIQHGGILLGVGNIAMHAFLHEDSGSYGWYGRLLVPYNYSAVTAACLMVSKEKLNEINGLDENLKVAYNDIDFCLRLLEKGYNNIFLPQVSLYHYESKSRGLDTTSEKYKQYLKERDYFLSKWNDKIKKDYYYNPNFSKVIPFMLDKKQQNNK